MPARHRLFISYSRQDPEWHERLDTHLRALDDILEAWSDKMIRPGSNWREEIDMSLEDADAAILIVTPHFLSSPFIKEREIPRLLERRSESGIPVFPIIAEPCSWQRVSWLESMQVFHIATEDGPQPSSFEINQKLTALMRQIEEALSAAGSDEPVHDYERARSDRQQRLERVVTRLRGLQAAKGKMYDDEKWHLGPEVERLDDAIATAGNDPEWRAACDRVRHAILLGGDPSQLEDCVLELEQLHRSGCAPAA